MTELQTLEDSSHEQGGREEEPCTSQGKGQELGTYKGFLNDWFILRTNSNLVYSPVPKMDDYRPSRTIHFWMFFADNTKIIQKWMTFCVISL